MRTSSMGTVRSARRGVASVELALVLPILLLFMFGIAEMGLMLRAESVLHNMARDACRALAAGEGEDTIHARVMAVSGSIDPQNLQLDLEFQRFLGTGSWSETWEMAETMGGNNTVPLHSRVRATVTYQHKLLLPKLFPFLTDNTANGTRELTARVQMLRS